MSFCCLLEWLYTGRCDFNFRVGLSTSREAAKLSDIEIFEVIRLADQYCLTELVTISEVQLSERIITKINCKVARKSKINSKREIMLDELVG